MKWKVFAAELTNIAEKDITINSPIVFRNISRDTDVHFSDKLFQLFELANGFSISYIDFDINWFSALLIH